MSIKASNNTKNSRFRGVPVLKWLSQVVVRFGGRLVQGCSSCVKVVSQRLVLSCCVGDERIDTGKSDFAGFIRFVYNHLFVLYIGVVFIHTLHTHTHTHTHSIKGSPIDSNIIKIYACCLYSTIYDVPFTQYSSRDKKHCWDHTPPTTPPAGGRPASAVPEPLLSVAGRSRWRSVLAPPAFPG